MFIATAVLLESVNGVFFLIDFHARGELLEKRGHWWRASGRSEGGQEVTGTQTNQRACPESVVVERGALAGLSVGKLWLRFKSRTFPLEVILPFSETEALSLREMVLTTLTAGEINFFNQFLISFTKTQLLGFAPTEMTLFNKWRPLQCENGVMRNSIRGKHHFFDQLGPLTR